MAALGQYGLLVLDRVQVGARAGFTQEHVAPLIHLPPRTCARRVASHARLKVSDGERAVRRLSRFDRAKQVFGTDEDARRWCDSRILTLGGKTPHEFAQPEPGAREIETIIGRIKHGVSS